ncbi:hypothetical protein HYPDE_28983 [Hyphomicrobium denitrificans 1NES1]|uniref:Uncharacterized protein n=1 Tax=Hyphomicrobium denitrificans 1NES1 TaxID=670307 RepID=N0BBI9_9HYPH|nr:hypothetical protein HYPDE_28983 [Hyphomicrobium denitrificans 1NES1]
MRFSISLISCVTKDMRHPPSGLDAPPLQPRRHAEQRAGTQPRISTGGLDDRLTRFAAQHFQEIARFFDGNHN